MLTVRSLIDALGGVNAAARAVSVSAGRKCSAPTVCYWLKENSVSAHWLEPLVEAAKASGAELGVEDLLGLVRSTHAHVGKKRKAAVQNSKAAIGAKATRRAPAQQLNETLP